LYLVQVEVQVRLLVQVPVQVVLVLLLVVAVVVRESKGPSRLLYVSLTHQETLGLPTVDNILIAGFDVRIGSTIATGEERMTEDIDHCKSLSDESASFDEDTDRILDENGTEDSSKIRLTNDATKSLIQLKLGALVLLILSALGIAVAVYFFMTSAEQREFVSQFQYDAKKILESIGTSTSRSLGILDSYAVVACSYTNFGNRSFPNITIPDFAIRAAKYRSACGGIIFSHLPIVTADERDAWEAYAWNKSVDWVNTTKVVQSNDVNHYGGAIFDGEPERRSIYDSHGNDIPHNST
jgi:hypothetical protein